MKKIIAIISIMLTIIINAPAYAQTFTLRWDLTKLANPPANIQVYVATKGGKEMRLYPFGNRILDSRLSASIVMFHNEAPIKMNYVEGNYSVMHIKKHVGTPICTLQQLQYMVQQYNAGKNVILHIAGDPELDKGKGLKCDIQIN